jgi:putative ABC transport system permease protein
LILAILIFGVFALLVKLSMDWFLHTEFGLALRATGDNPQMIRALGVNTDLMYIVGLALSNAFVSLSGALLTQFQGFSDVNIGQGLIIAGLAAVIIGETLVRPTRVATATTAAIIGMVIYRIVIAAALSLAIPLPGGATLRIQAQDVKFTTALLVLTFLWLTFRRSEK